VGTWSSAATLDASPERVLSVLTEPDCCVRWSPVPFELRQLDGSRLKTGSRGRLGGSLVGRKVDFELEILRADRQRLELRARGLVKIEARYEVRPAGDITVLRANVSVMPGPGLLGHLAACAADALLAAGALDQALQAIAGEVARSQPRHARGRVTLAAA